MELDLQGIYKRGDVYWLSRQVRGKRVWVSLETKDFSEAVIRAREIRGAPELNEGGLLKAEIDRYLDYKVQSGEFTHNTRRNAEGFLSWLPKSVGNISPGYVSSDDAQKFYKDSRGRMTESSAQTYVAHARSFFHWAVNVSKICRDNPFETVDMPELIPVARKEFCDPDLRDKLISECPRDDLKFILFCGFHTGQRRGEISEARPQWFDMRHRLLNIRKISAEMAKQTKLDPFDLKDREERTIPLSKAFTQFLKGWLNPDDDYCLSPGKRRKKNRYRYDFRRPFKEYMAAQGCPWVTPHTMRRTFASIQATKGTSIFIIAKWLGDDVETTQRNYAHLSPDHAQLESGI